MDFHGRSIDIRYPEHQICTAIQVIETLSASLEFTFPNSNFQAEFGKWLLYNYHLNCKIRVPPLSSHETLHTAWWAPPRPILVLLVGVLAVSTASIFIRFAQSEVPSLVIATYRLALAGLLLAPAALWRGKQAQPPLAPAENRQVLLAGLLLAFHFASWIASLELTSVVNSVVLVTTAPLWVAAASPVLLKEPVNRNSFIGLGLALEGGVQVGHSSNCSITGVCLFARNGELLPGQSPWEFLL
jgi:hypothetical protein